MALGKELIMEGDSKKSLPPRKKRRKYKYQAFLWLLPAFALMCVFSYYPPIKALIDSFFDTFYVRNSLGDLVTVDRFVGFGNYNEMFHDSTFWICIKNVLIFTAVGLVLGNLMTIILAELLYNLESKKLSSIFRVLFIIPILVPSLVILLIWKYIVFGSDGLLNQLLIASGSSPKLWYWDSSSDFIAKFSIIFTNFPWVAGTSFLIYLAGLQSIPSSVVEASKLDHCSTFKRIMKIDMPLIKSQLKYFLIMGVIGGFQNFDLQLIVVGGEYDATNVLGLYLYDRAFATGYVSDGVMTTRFGYASAVGMVIFFVTMLITILNMSSGKWKTRREEKKEEAPIVGRGFDCV